MKYTNINGIDFETHKSKRTKEMIDWHMKNYLNRDLYDHYEKPSNSKLEIYKNWLDWYLSTDYVLAFEVTSANIFGFTLGCVLVEPKTIKIIGYIRITKEHNYLYTF